MHIFLHDMRRKMQIGRSKIPNAADTPFCKVCCGLDKKNRIIIVGAGNLGQAIANYGDFERRGFEIIGIFDVNPNIVGTSVRGINIRSFSYILKSPLSRNLLFPMI